MSARLIIIAVATAIIFFVPLHSSLAAIDQSNQSPDLNDLDLPSALADDDSFNDLPFEQLRQALREEVEYGDQKGLSPRSFKKYNLLIR